MVTCWGLQWHPQAAFDSTWTGNLKNFFLILLYFVMLSQLSLPYHVMKSSEWFSNSQVVKSIFYMMFGIWLDNEDAETLVGWRDHAVWPSCTNWNGTESDRWDMASTCSLIHPSILLIVCSHSMTFAYWTPLWSIRALKRWMGAMNEVFRASKTCPQIFVQLSSAQSPTFAS